MPFVLSHSAIDSDIALLRIERNETKKTNLDEIIDEFASRKTRKVLLQDPVIERPSEFFVAYCLVSLLNCLLPNYIAWLRKSNSI